jgi:hypothetical protein
MGYYIDLVDIYMAIGDPSDICLECYEKWKKSDDDEAKSFLLEIQKRKQKHAAQTIQRLFRGFSVRKKMSASSPQP